MDLLLKIITIQGTVILCMLIMNLTLNIGGEKRKEIKLYVCALLFQRVKGCSLDTKFDFDIKSMLFSCI